MKKISVTLPLEEEEKKLFYQAIENANDTYDLCFQDPSDVKDASVIIGMIETDKLAKSKELEWLQIGWAGAENYCREGVLSPNAMLTNASGAYGNAVAEHMVALTMSLASSIQIYFLQQLQHRWELQQRMRVVSGSTVLVYGTGDIGTHYARIMKAMGCSVIGIKRTKKCNSNIFDEQYIAEEAEQVIGRADVIAMALPGGEQTRHIVDEAMIRKMKRGVILINAGRGSTIDTNALIDGLQEGIIGGAGLDVFEEEPLKDSPLWEMSNVIITPHAAGKLEDSYNRKKVVELCLDNLYRYTHGMELKHVVNRKLAY